MTRAMLAVLMIALIPACAFAVDGVTLINQATVTAAGGFPYNITQPGSYKLSGNLSVTSTTTTAITIAADNVTLDLNGFTIAGPGSGASLGSQGILSSRDDVSVKNGFVIGFQYGVRLSGTAITLVDLQSNDNAVYGFDMEPSRGGDGNAVLVRCTARSNGSVGFFVTGATISDSNASLNASDGFGGRTLTLIHNIALHNTGFGLNVDPRSVFGSNTIVGNVAGDVNSGNSQNNNVCSSGTC